MYVCIPKKREVEEREKWKGEERERKERGEEEREREQDRDRETDRERREDVEEGEREGNSDRLLVRITMTDTIHSKQQDFVENVKQKMVYDTFGFL